MNRIQLRWLVCIVFAVVLVVAEAQVARAAARDFVQPGNYAAQPATSQAPQASEATTTVTQQEILAGHLLRRIGFGPNKKTLKKAAKMGLTKYIDIQLNPSAINDSKAESKLPKLPTDFYDDYTLMLRWYVRMAYTQRLLQEKMTLIWHEHFSTSNEKVGVAGFMLDHENLLRKHSLGNFRDFLIEMCKDQAMLIWLDNNYNEGRDYPDYVVPNENFGREFLQLFTMGTKTLQLDGTPVLDGLGNPIPPYTETDVREVAKALTGWYAEWPYKHNNTKYSEWIHDDRDKNVLGGVIVGQTGPSGGGVELAAVVDRILTARGDTVAAFISKMLIQKLATETPSALYVQDVATAFKNSNWNIKTAVSTILKHPEFTAPTTLRSQYKEPIEQFVGMIRALDAKTKGDELINWTYDAGQLIYYPPSVFSFYPPGNKGALISTATVFIRDRVSDEYVRGWSDTNFDTVKLIKKNKLTSPTVVADWLEKALLAAPMSTVTRSEVINYMQGTVDDQKLRGAIWLVLCSPDYQRN